MEFRGLVNFYRKLIIFLVILVIMYILCLLFLLELLILVFGFICYNIILDEYKVLKI